MKLPLLEDQNDARLTRRCAISALAAAGLTACSSNTIIYVHPDASADDGGEGGTTDDAGCSALGQNVGAVTAFPQGTWKMVGDLIIGNDANGLFAFTAICPHQGCPVNPPSATGATYCACHGSRFDGNGKVTVGPARTSLEHYALAVCDGNVMVDTGTVVAATTRTPAA